MQLDLHAVGVILEHGIVETFAGQRIDIAEGGAELIVEKRPLNAGGQSMTNISDFLADLIPKLGNISRVH
ncbi:hypothetical protein D3C79_928630 [compost metagenome]